MYVYDLHTHTHTHTHTHIIYHTYLITQRNMWQKRAERFRRLVADPEFVGPQPFPFPDFPTLSTFHTFPTIPTLPPLRVERVDVALRDTVSYRGSTITVSRGGRVIRRWAWLRLFVSFLSGHFIFWPHYWNQMVAGLFSSIL